MANYEDEMKAKNMGSELSEGENGEEEVNTAKVED